MEAWAEVARGLALFLGGYGAGLVSMALWHRRAGERVSLNRVLAVAIMTVVTGASVLGVWNSYQMREQARCQSEVNAAFLGALSVNTEVNQANREALDSAVARLAESEPEQAPVILNEYLAEREQIEKQREDYPPLPEEVCG